jgi:cell division protein FtsZ
MKDVFDLVEINQENIVIKVISVSESGNDAVRNLEKKIDGVDFVYFDAIENTSIREILNDANMVFLIGATNDSKLNEIAEIVSDLNILTIAVVTKFLSFDAKNITQLLCDDLLNSITGITNLLVNAGMVNVDLEDIRVVLFGKSAAISGSSSSNSENRAMDATKQALASPLFREADLKNARAVLVNISASDMGLAEFSEVGDVICEPLSKDVRIKVGMWINPDLGDVMEVSVVVAGI